MDQQPTHDDDVDTALFTEVYTDFPEEYNEIVDHHQSTSSNEETDQMMTRISELEMTLQEAEDARAAIEAEKKASEERFLAEIEDLKSQLPQRKIQRTDTTPPQFKNPSHPAQPLETSNEASNPSVTNPTTPISPPVPTPQQVFSTPSSSEPTPSNMNNQHQQSSSSISNNQSNHVSSSSSGKVESNDSDLTYSSLPASNVAPPAPPMPSYIHTPHRHYQPHATPLTEDSYTPAPSMFANANFHHNSTVPDSRPPPSNPLPSNVNINAQPPTTTRPVNPYKRQTVAPPRIGTTSTPLTATPKAPAPATTSYDNHQSSIHHDPHPMTSHPPAQAAPPL